MAEVELTTSPPVPEITAVTTPAIVIKKSSKTPGIVIGVLLILVLVGYFIWIIVSSQNKTGFFKPYVPKLGPGLVKQVPDEKFVPFDAESERKRDELVVNALGQVCANIKASGKPSPAGCEIGPAVVCKAAQERGEKLGPGCTSALAVACQRLRDKNVTPLPPVCI